MQTVTLLALRAVGVMDARARGLVVQAVLPAKALVGRSAESVAYASTASTSFVRNGHIRHIDCGLSTVQPQ